MKPLALAFAMLVTGCGAFEPSGMPGIAASGEMESFKAGFVRETGRGGAIAVRQVSQAEMDRTAHPAGTVGLCTHPDGTVYLLKTYWDAVGDDERWALITHELGHCAFGLDHVNTVDASGCPDSIMYASAAYAGYCVNDGRKSRQYYIDSLINK